MSLSDLAELDINKIRLKTPVTVGLDGVIIRDILAPKTPLLIQTPNIYLPFGLSQQYQSEDRFWLKASLFSNNTKHISFRKKVEDFEQLLYQKINQKSDSETNFNQLDLTSSIKQGDDLFYPPAMTIKLHPQIKALINNIYGEQIKPSEILPGSWATLVICPKHLYIRPDTENSEQSLLGVTWYLIEARVRTPIPILNRSLIQEQLEDETLCSICYQKILKSDGFSMTNSSAKPLPPLPPEYQKYAKMLKLGIPLLAVIQKVQMDGLDPEVLRSHDRAKTAPHQISTNYTPPNPPPPPLPPPPSFTTSASAGPGPGRILFTASDLQKGLASLGKGKPVKLNKKVISIKKRDPRVPSLSMIQESLGKLKKTNRVLL